MHRLTLTVQFSTINFAAEKTGGYDLIKIKGGGLTTRIGWPQLPVTIKHFVLPAQATKVKLKWQREKWTRFPGLFTLAPAQPIRPANPPSPNGEDQFHPSLESNPHMQFGRPGRIPLPLIPTADGVEYQNNDTFIPVESQAAKAKLISLPTCEISSISQVGRRPVVAIRLHPMRYSPRTGKVQVLLQVELHLEYSPSRPQRKEIQQRSAPLGQDMWKLMSLVENPQDIGFEFPALAGFDNVSLICPDDPLLKLKHQAREISCYRR
jgi:hypothetical protein